MDMYILPDSVVTDLQRFGEATQLCDGAGRALGLFVPKVDSSKYEAIGPEPSDEELDSIEKSTEWYSTADLLSRLEKLK